MIKHLQLKNFRKHRGLELTFDGGLVAIRGNNEQGKSTVYQGVAYALFGSRALAQPLEDVVTWGEPAGSLQVELTAVIAGQEVHVKRSQRGAELRIGERLVTGQTETTNVIAELVGAPAALATSLWLAPQNSIRGALGSGSKATSSLIEQLADFEQIDKILEAIQSNLPTGATKPFEERLAQAEATLAEIGEPQPPQDRTQRIGGLLASLEKLRAQQREYARDLRAHEEGVMAPLLKKTQAWEAAKKELGWQLGQLEDLSARIEGAVIPPYDAQEHESAKADLARAQEAERSAGAYRAAKRAFDALPAETSVWEGDGPSFVAYAEENEKRLQETRSQIATTQAELAALNKQVLEGNCAVCGLDYDSVPSVGERNNEVKAARKSLQDFAITLDSQLRQLEVERNAIRSINQRWQIVRDFVARHDAFIAVDDSVIPQRVSWVAVETVSTEGVTALESRVKALKAARSASEAAVAQLAGWKADKLAAQEKVAALQEKADKLQVKLEEVETAKYNLTAFSVALESCSTHVQRLEGELRDEQSAQTQESALYTERKRSWSLANAAAEQARAQLAEVEFNNVLLKKIRSARPLVIDQLWATLLAAVSHYFSTMRGVQSSVTREAGIFLVDGRPVEGLSGSTLDVLGLAIRVALLKTFLPACNFLLLDEPAAACDDEREAALLGTIAAAGFTQTIVVTHSDLAEPFANQLVTL